MTYGVPNLKLDDFVVDLENVGTELDSNRDHVLLLELVVHNALHKGRFADASVSNND